jgi:hypothetical protein
MARDPNNPYENNPTQPEPKFNPKVDIPETEIHRTPIADIASTPPEEIEEPIQVSTEPPPDPHEPIAPKRGGK